MDEKVGFLIKHKALIICLLAAILITEGVIIADRWISFKPIKLARIQHRQPSPSFSKNQLLIKEKNSLKGPIEITLAERVNLNFKKRDEILAIREEAVQQHPGLFKPPYKPMGAIFDQIVDGKPWWGEDGLFFFSKGKKSIDGMSERSFMIVNPFLLVDCMEWGTPFIYMHELDFVEFFEAKFTDPDFSHFAKPAYLIWHPESGRAEVTYRMGDFLTFVNRHSRHEITPKEISLAFRMLNARDWGFAYSFFDWPSSSNMDVIGRTPALNENMDYLHLGGSCGYPGGCNNLSPEQPELENIRIKQLPANARWFLWRKKPKDHSNPDFIFEIKFI